MEIRVEENESLKPFMKLMILITSIWFISFIAIYFGIDNWADRGTFGDLFGGINSLFSGLALAGIIYTIFLQRKELKLQRLELRETRKELQRTAEAQEKSEVALKEQANNLKSASQLSALNSLVVTYTEQEQFWSGKHNGKRDQAKLKKETYIKQIELILKNIV